MPRAKDRDPRPAHELGPQFVAHPDAKDLVAQSTVLQPVDESRRRTLGVMLNDQPPLRHARSGGYGFTAIPSTSTTARSSTSLVTSSSVIAG